VPSYASNVRPSVNHLAGAPDAEKEQVELVEACVQSFEGGIGQDFRDRCNARFRQYRGFSAWQSAWVRSTDPRDKDAMLRDAKAAWGAQLHIPLSFRTIESMVPRAIAHAPRMLYLPRHPQWAENVEPVRMLIDSQQENIDIDLSYQAVMRSGRIYGLGVGKSFWRKEYAQRRRVKRRTINLPWLSDYYVSDSKPECVFDDPDFEDVDVFDFMWDPYGSGMLGSSRCRWVCHRLWFGVDEVVNRLQSGVWGTESARILLEGGPEKIALLASGNKYDEVWQERMEASGFSSFQNADRDRVIEVHEYHDGDRVLTVIGRQVLVQDGENPCLGHIPFHVYRPTPLQRQMVGIGDLEPLEHLQREMDTTRSQMVDAVTIMLAAGWAYDSAMVDEEDLVFGPHSAIEVRNGRPSDALMPLPRPELPSTAFEHMRQIYQDFDAVSGISDALDPSAGGTVSTATQAQLVQAALSRRIALGSRRFEIEVVRQSARAFLYMDQRMITQARDPMMARDQGMDMEQAAREGRYRWVDIGPESIMGEFHIAPEGGSMAERNIQQDRMDAVQILQNFLAGPAASFVDPERPILKAIELFGERDARSWLKRSDPPIPPMALEILQKAGVPPELIQRAVQQAQQADPRLAQGPDTAQVDQMMGDGQEQGQQQAVAA
jgi:hypothetical protein